MLMAFFGSQRAVWVDRDQPGAASFGLLGARPEMQIRRDRIRAPDEDNFALLEKLREHAEARAIGVFHPRHAGSRADRPIQLRCTELVEKPLGNTIALN